MGLVGVLAVGCSAPATTTGHGPTESSSRAARSPQTAHPQPVAPVAPSPPPPPFGYCGGLRFYGTLPSGPYLLVLGDTDGRDDYPAFGEDGVYRIHRRHAYRTCYDYNQQRSQVVRRGITTIRGLTRLFRRALHPHRP